MKLIETRGRIAEDGSVILLPGVLETMGVAAGDHLWLTYLTDQAVEASNVYGQIMMTPDGIEGITGPFEAAEAPEIVIPHVLLEEAEIPIDGELDIQCVPGMIVISSADPLDSVPPCLMELFDTLQIDHEVIRSVLREGGF